jgi:rhodanese-related sulfurtransferase
MTAPTDAAVTSTQLRDLLASSAPLRILDVRPPAEFETSHISGSYNVPLDLLNQHGPEVVRQLDNEHDVVLVCRSGQRSIQAAELLRNAGLTGGRVLEKGITDWEGQGFALSWRPTMGARAAAAPGSRIGRAYLCCRERRPTATQMAGGGDRRRLGLRRDIQHLRNGNGAVQVAL